MLGVLGVKEGIGGLGSWSVGGEASIGVLEDWGVGVFTPSLHFSITCFHPMTPTLHFPISLLPYSITPTPQDSKPPL